MLRFFTFLLAIVALVCASPSRSKRQSAIADPSDDQLDQSNTDSSITPRKNSNHFDPWAELLKPVAGAGENADEFDQDEGEPHAIQFKPTNGVAKRPVSAKAKPWVRPGSDSAAWDSNAGTNEVDANHPDVRVPRPPTLYTVKLLKPHGNTQKEALVNQLLEILVSVTLIDRRTAAYVLARLGINGRDTLSGLDFLFKPRVNPDSPPLPSCKIESLFVRGHPVAVKKFYASLAQLNEENPQIDLFLTDLIEFMLESEVLEATQAYQLALARGVKFTTVKKPTPEWQDVVLSYVLPDESIDDQGDELPSIIIQVLHILVEKHILPISTGSNILATFDIEVISKYPGSVISCPTQVHVSGKPLRKAKFIVVLFRLIDFQSWAPRDKTLSHLAKLLFELALDNGVVLEEQEQYFEDFDLTIHVQRFRKSEDDPIFDVPEPDPTAQPEPEDFEDAATSTSPAAESTLTTKPVLNSKTTYTVTITTTAHDDNSEFVRKLIETAKAKGILATAKVQSLAKLPKIYGDGEATERFLESLTKIFKETKEGTKSKSYLQRQVITTVLELLLDNGALGATDAGDLAFVYGVHADIRATTKISKRKRAGLRKLSEDGGRPAIWQLVKKESEIAQPNERVAKATRRLLL